MSASEETTQHAHRPSPPREKTANEMTDAEWDAFIEKSRRAVEAEGGVFHAPFRIVNAPTPAVAIAPITLSDIATFHADPGAIDMEPEGWMVIGLDANFVATATIHTVSGTLLGLPASVRFTPVSFGWDYGDGATRRTATGGGTWAELGVAEFTPTPTSHVYAAVGTYAVTLTVEFSASYSFAGQPWVPITGTLPVLTAPIQALASEARTVLVARDCVVDPAGPGC